MNAHASNLRHGQKGLTIVELLVTLSIAAITLTFGVSGFRSIIASSQATVQVNDMVAGINLARSEAIKRGASVQMLAKGGAWSSGWQVGIDANADGDFADAGDTLIRDWSPAGSALTPVNGDGITSISFSPRGYPAASTRFTFTDCPSGSNSGKALDLGASGHASVSKVACGG
ncbi:MAG: GspH/FimT family pseudopilin [bacterium]